MKNPTIHDWHFYILDVCRMLQGHIIRYFILSLIFASISCCAVHKPNESSQQILVVSEEDGLFLNELFDSVRGDFNFQDKKLYLHHSASMSDYIDNLFFIP